MEPIKLDRASVPKLPADIKILDINGTLVVMRWSLTGWRQVSAIETIAILKEYTGG
jgi:hypothetical protein